MAVIAQGPATPPAGISIADSYRQAPRSIWPAEKDRQLAELIAELQPSAERTTLEPSHLGLDFVFTVKGELPNSRWIRWAVTRALASERAIIGAAATPAATSVAIRLVTSIRTTEGTQRIASALAPAFIMLALPRPDQQLWLGGDSFELRLTMPYQDDLEYLAEMAPAIIGMIDSLAESSVQSLRTFDDLVTSSQQGVSLVAAGPGHPLAISGRHALLTASQGGTEIELAADKVLRDLFSVSESWIAQLTEGSDLDELGQRIAGTLSLPVDHWPQASAPFVPDSYAYGSPPRSYDYVSPAPFSGAGDLSGLASPPYSSGYPYQSPPYGSGYPYPSPPYSSDYPFQSPPFSPGTQYPSPPLGSQRSQAQPGAGTPEKESRLSVTVRRVSAAVVGVLLAGYVAAVLTGWLPTQHKLGVTELGTLVVGLAAVLFLLQPKLLARVSEVSLGGIKLQLRDIAEKQAEQSEELRLSRFALFLALPKEDRNLLRGLQNDIAVWREGTGESRNESRRLADLGLIKRRPGRAVRDLKDGWFDVRDFVELTDRGRRYLLDIRDEGID